MRNILAFILISISIHCFSQDNDNSDRIFYKLNNWDGDYFGTVFTYSDFSIVIITDTVIYYVLLTEYETDYHYCGYSRKDPVEMLESYYAEFKPYDSIWLSQNKIFKLSYELKNDTIRNIQYYNIIKVKDTVNNISDSISSNMFVKENALYWVTFKNTIQRNATNRSSKIAPIITDVFILEEYQKKTKKRKKKRKKNKD